MESFLRLNVRKWVFKVTLVGLISIDDPQCFSVFCLIHSNPQYLCFQLFWVNLASQGRRTAVGNCHAKLTIKRAYADWPIDAQDFS
jgi:hypothetical protein